MIDDPMLYEQDPADAGFVAPEENAEESPAPKTKLQLLIDSDNIAEDLEEETLKKIGRRCHEGYDVDNRSRSDWTNKTKDAIKLAQQVMEEKTSPWPGAANVKLPLITDATIKFAARAYSEIIRNNQVAKGKTVGADPDGSKVAKSNRIADFISWQLLEQETEWEPDTDKLLHCLPVVGHMFRKRYYCRQDKRTKSEICMPDKVVINQQAASLETARRVTHVIENVSQNEVVSNQRAGIWLKVEFKEKDERDKTESDDLEQEDYFTILEQQCWLDLDEDGYEEPYIVTFEKESMKVARIVANYGEDDVAMNDSGEIMKIKPRQCFVDYIFIPSLDGTYYGTGFGQLMGALNKSANTIVNQLLDSGTLNIMQCGYLSKEVKVMGGTDSFRVGEWKRTQARAEELRYGVFPLPTKEPSPTLFNLLGLIMDLTKDLSSVKDVLGGDSPGGNVPATTIMALIEQGMKTFNAIYKRIYRSLKGELKQLCGLNYLYLDDEEYFDVLDDQMAVRREDFDPDGKDVIPVADPNMSSEMQRIAQAEALRSAIGMPGVDPKPIMQMWLEALRVPSDKAKAILPDQDPNGVPPHVQQMLHEVEMKGADIANKERELDLKEQELLLKQQEIESKGLESVSKAVLNFANAEAVEPGQQLQAYQANANAILQEKKLNTQAAVAAQKAQAESPTT